MGLAEQPWSSLGLAGACLESCSALEIERRPRGASRASSLLHRLQRAMTCEFWVASLWRMAIYRVEAVRADSQPRRTYKAVNHGLTDIGTLQKM